jgi:hypothetical protein
MNLYEFLSNLEECDDLHESRLLLLLAAFTDDKNEAESGIEGLTKLAKLDFLLRYPTYLERALRSRPNGKPAAAAVQPHERQSVESSMVRFKYGPWDHRYRRFLNLLVAKGLATVHTSGRTISIRLSEEGKQAAAELAKADVNKDIVLRAKLLRKNFDLTATNLMKLIYRTFPEIGTLRLGAEISHEN